MTKIGLWLETTFSAVSAYYHKTHAHAPFVPIKQKHYSEDMKTAGAEQARVHTEGNTVPTILKKTEIRKHATIITHKSGKEKRFIKNKNKNMIRRAPV